MHGFGSNLQLGRTRRGYGRAALVLALVFTILAGGQRSALASHQYLWWSEDGNSFARFGSNASITIYQGQIEFACDTFVPAADIYVVPTGSASQGASLTDVSGAP